MTSTFVCYTTDNELVKHFKREANNALASLDIAGSKDVFRVFNIYQNCLGIIKLLGEFDVEDVDDIKEILDTCSKFWNNNILGTLTLKDDEFGNEDSRGNRKNLRYGYIREYFGDIYNDNAYNVLIRKSYNHDEKIEIANINYNTKSNERVYITKGGVVTGDYINDCIITEKEVRKGHFSIQSVVNLNVSSIYSKRFGTIYTIDNRDSKFKALREFYDVPIRHNDDIASAKMDIRKYKKIK